MSEETNNAVDTNEAAAQGKGDAKQPVFAIKRIYLKDLSFETPMGLEAFNQKQAPKVEQELNVQMSRIDEQHHEVVLLLTITAKLEDRTAFLIEVKQAGVFAIANMDDVHVAHTINSTCPTILFPYARETIDSVLSRGTFSALMLPPINFDAAFAQAINSVRKQAESRQQQAPETSEAGAEQGNA